MTKQDHLQGFEHTKVSTTSETFYKLNYPNQIQSQKEAFYIHIKVLWGLASKKAILVARLEKQVRAFYQQFQSINQVEYSIV